MSNEYVKKSSTSLELTIEVDVNFVYNEDSLINYNVWFNRRESNPVDLVEGLDQAQIDLVEEAIEERINEVKYEG